jgi:hypothetical protein
MSDAFSHEGSRGRAAWTVGALLLLLPPILLAPAWRLWGLSGLEDGLLYYLPQRVWFAERIRAGEWPLWQRETYGGFPVFADPQMAMYYPPTWLFVVLPPQRAYPLSICLHYSLAGWLMYRLCRGLDRGRRAAALGAVLWMFSGFMLSHREHLTMHHAAAWAPGVVWAWHRWASTGRPGHWVLGVALVAMQILAGHVQIPLMTAPLALAWVAWVAPRRRRVWLGALAGFAVAALACSVQIIPSLQLLGESAGRRDYHVLAWNSLSYRSLALLLFPLLFGQRTPNFYAAPWFGPSHQCEQTAYVTLIGLALAIGGWVLMRRTDRRVRFWGWAVLIGLVLSLGRNAGVYILMMLIPLFNVLHTPARWLMVVHMGLIILAAFGADALIRPMDRRPFADLIWRRWIPRGMAVAAVLILAWFCLAPSAQPGRAAGLGNPAIWLPLGLMTATVVLVTRLGGRGGRASCPPVQAGGTPAPHAAESKIQNPKSKIDNRRDGLRGIAIIALAITDLATVAPFLDVSTSSPEAITRSPAAEVLRTAGFRRETDRVWVIPGDPYSRSRECLMPDTNLLDGVSTFNGYGPMLPKEQRELMRFERWGITDEAKDWLACPEILSRLGVGYVVLRDPNIPRGELPGGWEPLGEAPDDVRIYRNRNPAPLWYTTDKYHWCSRQEEAVAEIRAEMKSRRPRGPVLLEGVHPPGQVVGPGRTLDFCVLGSSARFTVGSDSGTLLVWLNHWYPGWRATVDGREAALYRADVLGQGIFVPAGQHRVEFRFEPQALGWGIALSLLGTVICVALLILRRRTPVNP